MKRFLAVLLCVLGSQVAWSQGSSSTNAYRTVLVPMRDGVKLATDVYLPGGNSPNPVVVVRTPYNKAGMIAAGAGAAKLGYAVVIQDTRGRFASEGENLPFNIEDKDGFDTLEWVAKQGWCNGKIGTFGGSALGIAQLQLAGSGTAELACQHITVAEPDLYNLAYTGGVFRKALVEDWLRASKFSPRALELWAGHFRYDRYWRQRDMTQRFKAVNAPAIHIGGYFDIFAQGTIDAFLGCQNKGGPGARGRQKLLMGPWTHGVLTDKAGDLVFPGGKRPPNDVQDQYRWWERYLKGVRNGVDELPAVTYYVMGDVFDTNAPGNKWRTADQWPPVTTKCERWYLDSDLGFSPGRPSSTVDITYIYDPANPAPTVGGYELTIPAGPKDQRPIEERGDVVVLTSAPLSEPMEVTGTVRTKLYVSSDVPDTDFFVRLCDVYSDGKSFNICEGMLRARFRNSLIEPEPMIPGKTYGLEIDLWPTSMVFNQGHRLRIDITSSSAPGYDPNPNTCEPLRWSDRKVVAHNTIHVVAPFLSYVDLPVAASRHE
jgi:predicted acyl esterase